MHWSAAADEPDKKSYKQVVTKKKAAQVNTKIKSKQWRRRQEEQCDSHKDQNCQEESPESLKDNRWNKYPEKQTLES